MSTISVRDLSLQLDIPQADISAVVIALGFAVPGENSKVSKELDNASVDKVIEFISVAHRHNLSIRDAIARVSGAQQQAPASAGVDTAGSKDSAYNLALSTQRGELQNNESVHQMNVVAAEMLRHRQDQELAIQALMLLKAPSEQVPPALRQLHQHATQLDPVLEQLRGLGQRQAVDFDATGTPRVLPGKPVSLLEVAENFAAPRLAAAPQVHRLPQTPKKEK